MAHPLCVRAPPLCVPRAPHRRGGGQVVEVDRVVGLALRAGEAERGECNGSVRTGGAKDSGRRCEGSPGGVPDKKGTVS